MIKQQQNRAEKQLLQKRKLAKNVLGQECWNIYCKQWSQYDLNSYFVQIINANVKDIWIRTHQLNADQQINSQIINALSQVKFKNLVSLNFDKNQLNSVQFLQRIDMPNLQKLRISQNHIIQCKSLRKLHLPYLQDLILNKNMFIGDLHLNEMNLKNLNNLALQFYRQKLVQGQNMEWMFKLDCHYIQFIRILSEKRILPENKINQLKQKFMKLKY